MPAVFTNTTVASTSIANAAERTWANVTLNFANLLVVGDNVIAVEIHQDAPNSSDIAMNLLLSGNVVPVSNGDSLITNNETNWRFLVSATDPGATWKSVGLNETSWGTGTTILGYGDADTNIPNHVVGDGANAGNGFAKNITTYFRKHFTLTNPIPGYLSLNLSLICDDGAVVYLNGTQIYSQNMPAVFTNTTVASTSIANAAERTWTNVTLNFANLLVVGDNVIAVEIHQDASNSSDIAMNLLLKGNTTVTPPTVTRGPYLHMLGTNSITVRWQTATATDSKVSYGLTTGYGSSVTNATVSTEHEVSIPSGLTQDTKYFYQIGTTTVNITSDVETFFKTALPAGTTTDFTAWVTGDFGTGLSGQTGVRDAYTAYAAANLPNGKADFWIWLGDNAYDSGTVGEYNSYVFGIYPNIMKNTPIFPSVGNHDYANHGDAFPGASFPYPTAPYEYFSAFSMPQNAELGGVASTTKRYYSYNYGNVHFIVLDSYGVVTNSNTVDAVNNPMYTWLRNDLMANTKKWTVCYFHHPPYSMGTHNSDTEVGMANMRQYYVPLLETHHVDLVLSGHSHNYERSFLTYLNYGLETSITPAMKINATMGDVSPYYTKSLANGVGTVYAVCGNSGKGGVVSGQSNPPLPAGNTIGYPHDAMARSFNTLYGSMILTFKTDELDAKFLTSTGTINDSFKIIKNSCVTGVTVEESVTSGDWHTTSTWGCGTIPTTDSMVKINAGHTVTLNTANTADIKKIYVFGMLRYLSNKQLRLKN
jgi:Calcineurin-like phosphoesterase